MARCPNAPEAVDALRRPSARSTAGDGADTVRAMRRVHRPWPLLVLIALAGLLGPPAVASASDAGLRTLVSEQRALEKQQETRAKATVAAIEDRVGSATSGAQAGRRAAQVCRSIARQSRRVRIGYAGYLARFQAEAPETNEATVGRTLMIRGLRGSAPVLRRYEAIMRRAAARFSRVRTPEGLVRVADRLSRDETRIGQAAKRPDQRLKRGRTLIRNAPAVPVPAA